ncbi:hypothetical protein, partial [Actinokineospora sp.]|uniref:hypothetical protein n=1 Tax=Actinokineospora sp. TaxID=1872133 RepID=UPI003D6AECF8
LDEFARELLDVQLALRRANRELDRTMRLGPCPTVVKTEHDDRGRISVEITCAATLRIKIGHDTITCRACDTSWPRACWAKALGDPWVDYAALSETLAVPVGTLWRWAHEDGWRTSGTRARRLVHRDDALDSHARRRQPTEQAG